MRAHRSAHPLALVLGALVLTACSSPDSAPTAPSTDDAPYTRTIVRRGADGTMTSTTVPVRAPSGLRVEGWNGSGSPPSSDGGLFEDTGCAASALWLFDKAGFTGNELCFIDVEAGYMDHADLASYTRYVCGRYCLARTWAQGVRSWRAGIQSGIFRSTVPGTDQAFAAGASEATASPAVQGALRVDLEY